MDSELDTRRHCARVLDLMINASGMLLAAGQQHDKSKLMPEEKPSFDELTPKLAKSTFGSEEYKGFLAAMKPALDHHYAVNRHHPEHFPDLVNGMTLMDLIEMLCDWKAASERHATGDIAKSLEINVKRFGIGPQLESILRETVRMLFPPLSDLPY